MDPNSMETYFGLIKTPHDALIIFEACHLGIISRVHRRLSDIERQSVRSGSVYCFDEREAGMRRWTDGKSWSPSRVTGSFLTYRELDDSPNPATTAGASKTVYRPDGLLKQSFSITTSDNKKLHLISYYTNEDVASERLFETPSRDPRFANIVIPKGIYPETSSHTAGPAAPSSASSAASDSASATSTHHSSPSPPTPHRSRHRPHHRAFQNNNSDAEHLRRIDTMAGHRRTHSGNLSVMSRYSPIQTSNDNLHGLGSRSRSNSHNVSGGYSAAPYYGAYGGVGPSPPEKRYKSSSPTAGSSFPTPPPNAYSPTTSWASEDDQPMITDTVTPESLADIRGGVIGREELMIPPLREPYHQQQVNQLPLLATNFDHHKVAGFGAHRGNGPESNNEMEPYSPAVSSATTGSAHEQDSLSVLANLATDTLLLPKLEPKEISSRERVRWVEDDRQLRALSSMLRL
ncbi:MAG: Gti1/Pac2 family-domain-containing protein [Linnemannia gamsii]|nr:MAG: Gti1/Pac2 family-domain-containing protein [Linnemannia gamsii]